jgi:phage regulator Rha-like protein
MLDRNLAVLYGVENRVLKQAVRRNINRFPLDFMFELAKKEYQTLRSQNVILKRGQHSKYLPFVFTEQGVAMLSSVLKSERAVQVNIQIMRAFIKMRQMYISHDDLKQKIIAMERKYDKQFQIVFEAIQQLLEEDENPKRKIGYIKTPKSASGKEKQTICSQ